MTTKTDNRLEKVLLARERMNTAIVVADELCRKNPTMSNYSLHFSEHCKQASLKVLQLASDYETILNLAETTSFINTETTVKVTKN